METLNDILESKEFNEMFDFENEKKEVEAAGLQKPLPPKPLDAVAENQVKLVCWMAVKAQ